MTRAGFPHSEISGSKPVCGSPKHIAAYHVLHRLLTPSHPPQTLRSLTFMSFLEPNHSCFLRQDCIGLLEDVRLPYEIVKEQKILDLSGLEPLTSCVQSRRSTS